MTAVKWSRADFSCTSASSAGYYPNSAGGYHPTSIWAILPEAATLQRTELPAFQSAAWGHEPTYASYGAGLLRRWSKPLSIALASGDVNEFDEFVCNLRSWCSTGAQSCVQLFLLFCRDSF